LPMTGVMACCAIVSFSILTIGSKTVRYHATLRQIKEETAEMIITS
jgi:hypothetical protein